MWKRKSLSNSVEKKRKKRRNRKPANLSFPSQNCSLECAFTHKLKIHDLFTEVFRFFFLLFSIKTNEEWNQKILNSFRYCPLLVNSTSVVIESLFLFFFHSIPIAFLLSLIRFTFLFLSIFFFYFLYVVRSNHGAIGIFLR